MKRFSMSMSEYLTIDALSSSGIKNLLISPLEYWYNSPMNPDYEEEETSALKMGTAIHSRLLDGVEAFESIYYRKFNKANHIDALEGQKQLKDACKSLGLKVSGTIDELILRIKESGLIPEIQFMRELEQEYDAIHESGIDLSDAEFRQIDIAVKAIGLSDAQPYLGNSEKEVVLTWTDMQTGVPMKSRIDCLGKNFILDLKTFQNSSGRNLNKAVSYALMNYSYDIQAETYLEAARNNDFNIEEFIFLFVQTGAVPNVVIKRYSLKNGLGVENVYSQNAKLQYRRALETYARCKEKFGNDPWIIPAGIGQFEDSDFPLSSLMGSN